MGPLRPFWSRQNQKQNKKNNVQGRKCYQKKKKRPRFQKFLLLHNYLPLGGVLIYLHDWAPRFMSQLHWPTGGPALFTPAGIKKKITRLRRSVPVG